MHAGKTRVCRASIDSEGGGNVPRRADEYLKQLAKVPMFRALSKCDLALVKRNAEDHKIRAGESLVKEGSRGHEFLLILNEREFSGLLAEVPSLARKVLTGMARRLHEADSKIVY